MSGRVDLEATVNTFCKDIRVEVKRTREKTGVTNGIYDYPAVAVVASDVQLTHSSRGRSGKVYSSKEYHDAPTLEKKLQSFGKIGKKRAVCDNTIGACAEPHAARKVIKHFKQRIALKRIVFSTAYRPRTMEVIDYCKNCKDTFPTL